MGRPHGQARARLGEYSGHVSRRRVAVPLMSLCPGARDPGSVELTVVSRLKEPHAEIRAQPAIQV